MLKVEPIRKVSLVNGIVFSLPFILSLLWVISACAEMKEKEGIRVGGICEYKAYKGRAKIISITPRKGDTDLKNEYEIKFLFFPEEEIMEPYARADGKEFLLLINNAYFPDRPFIQKYDIKIGKIFDCSLRVIVKGTCTPILFEFPFTK